MLVSLYASIHTHIEIPQLSDTFACSSNTVYFILGIVSSYQLPGQHQNSPCVICITFPEHETDIYTFSLNGSSRLTNNFFVIIIPRYNRHPPLHEQRIPIFSRFLRYQLPSSK